MAEQFSLMIHGGAGELEHEPGNESVRTILEGMKVVLERGRDILSRHGTALNVVELCATLLEDNPVFNAGRGSVFNKNGRVETDAGIMDGLHCKAGAVGAVDGIANPVQLARRVLDKSSHVLLTGQGARDFAVQEGFKIVDQAYFHTDRRWQEYESFRQKQPGSEASRGENAFPFGTIGAVALDKSGNLAAATSTGGITGKSTGRIGDSPLPGAGYYADNASCGVSCTGRGEDFMCTVLARYIADLLEMRQMDIDMAVVNAMDYLRQKNNGRGGAIVIDRHGHCAAGRTTNSLFHGWIEHGGESHCRYQ